MVARKFGYARVSSRDQNEARQLETLHKAGVEERDLYIDKATGKNFDREQYQIMKRALREGDVLYIHSLDRFGRNKDDILAEWTDITKNIGADIIVLDMPLLDTTKYKDSVGTFVADLVLQILSWIAEEERTKIKTRQREGIDAAMKAGVKFGRKKTEVSAEFIDAYNEWKAGNISAVEAMKRCGIKKTTFYKLVKEYEGAH